MTTIYEIGTNLIWTGVTQEIAEDAGVAGPWTRSQVPPLASGEYAEFDGVGWRIVTQLPSPPLPEMPDLTMRQFRLGLLHAGLLASVDGAIEGLPEPDRSAARIEFEYASIVVRKDPWVSSLAILLGLTDQEIDALWSWAATL